MNNNIFQVTFAKHGGAGKVAITLNDELNRIGKASELIFASENNSLKNYLLNGRAYFLSVIDNVVLKRKMSLPFFSLTRALLHSRKFKRKLLADVLIHLHWTPGLINLKKISDTNLSRTKIVVTLHDMWFFTGGCHFSNDCTQFRSGCRSCPMVRSLFRPLVAKQFQIKQDFFSKHPGLKVTCPSKDLLEKASQSEILKLSEISYIPNLISKDIIFKGSKEEAKANLGIENGYFIVGFVASRIGDPRKNVSEGVKAVRKLVNMYPHGRIKLIILGKGSAPKLKSDRFIEVKNQVSDPKILAAYYAAFDVLLVTSTQENSPLVVLEALANKTYVITSQAGGSKEMIKTNINGYVYKNENDLFEALATELNKEQSFETQKKVDRESLSQSVNNYVSLYNMVERY